jgi:hypothetical protein
MNTKTSFYIPEYCNHPHSLEDGEAMWHACTRLSPTKLRIKHNFGENAVKEPLTEFYPGEMEALKNNDKNALEQIYWQHAPALKVQDVINKLIELSEKSPLGKDTIVHVFMNKHKQLKNIQLKTDNWGNAEIIFIVK